MRTINTDEIIQTVKEMCIEANHFLSDDMAARMKKAVDEEESPLGKQILIQLQENLQIAGDDMIPICQDTDMAVVFIKLPIEMDRTAMSSIIWNHLRQGKEDQSVLQVRLQAVVWISILQKCLIRD